MCRMCGKKGESVSDLTSECSKLAQREYKRQHHNVRGMSIGNCVGRKNWNGLIGGTKIPHSKW